MPFITCKQIQGHTDSCLAQDEAEGQRKKQVYSSLFVPWDSILNVGMITLLTYNISSLIIGEPSEPEITLYDTYKGIIHIHTIKCLPCF